MAFAEYGPSVAASVEDGCQSGRRHGVVMEQLFFSRGIANVAADVDSMCPPPGRRRDRDRQPSPNRNEGLVRGFRDAADQ